MLTRDEFLDLFFEDLELPDLVKSQIVATETTSPTRAGVSVDGSPSQIDMARSLRQSMARRIGLRRPTSPEVLCSKPKSRRLRRLATPHSGCRILQAELALALRRLARVPWIDPMDLRYRRYTQTPKPSARAVMFCLMDVSGSMSEQMKDIAKRFFLLLHVFLERRYKRVELVFIRHTETAEEVDEQTFFTDPRTGGTVVSTALAESCASSVRAIRRIPGTSTQRKPRMATIPAATRRRRSRMLENDILPVVQYFAYIEVASSLAHDQRRERALAWL